MKKTKLLTSLSALLLVLSVGACNNNVTEDSSSEGTTSEETTTSESSSTGDTEVSTEGAYALYGDFVDSSWNESPDTSSKYFIPAGTEEYKVTVTIAGEPVDDEWWSDENQWDAGFRVIEYGDYGALVVGSDDLDEASTGVIGSDSEKNIKVNWNTTYYITITFGETPSILVQEELEPATDPAGLVNNAALTGNYSVEIEYEYYESDSTITYAEYELAIAAIYGDTSEEAIAALEKYSALEDDVTLAQTIAIDLYYDTDYIYLEEYIDNQLYMIDVTINADDGPWEYWTYNGSSWSYYSPAAFASVGASVWEDYYYSLFDAAEKGTADHLAYETTSDGYDVYDFDDWKYNSRYGYISQASADWFCCLGGDHLFGLSNAWNYAYYYYMHYYTFFEEDDQELTSWYEYAYLGYVDYDNFTGADSDELYFGEEDIFMTVYDVGETDKRETVEYYHNGLQASINGSN